MISALLIWRSNPFKNKLFRKIHIVKKQQKKNKRARKREKFYLKENLSQQLHWQYVLCNPPYGTKENMRNKRGDKNVKLNLTFFNIKSDISKIIKKSLNFFDHLCYRFLVRPIIGMTV